MDKQKKEEKSNIILYRLDDGQTLRIEGNIQEGQMVFVADGDMRKAVKLLHEPDDKMAKLIESLKHQIPDLRIGVEVVPNKPWYRHRMRY